MGAAILLSLLVTIITQWNLSKAIFFQGYLADPYIVSENDDEMFYLTLVEGARCGAVTASPYLQAWKQDQFTYPFLGVRIEAGVACLTGWSIKITSIVFDYLAVFLLCMSVFFATRKFFEQNVPAFLTGALYLLWPSILHSLSRPVSPQVNGIFFFLALGGFFSSSRTRIRAVLEGLGVASLFYVYPYYWSFFLPWLVFREIWMWYRHIWTRAHLWMYGALLVGIIPFGFYTQRIHRLPFYADSMRRLGLLADRLPAGFLLLVSILVMGCLLMLTVYRGSAEWRSSERDRIFLIASGLIVSGIVLTQQLVTGVQLEAAAHDAPMIYFVFALEIGFVWNTIFQKRSFWVKRAGVLCACLILLVIGVKSWVVRAHHNPFLERTGNSVYPTDHSEQEVYAWLNAQGIHDQVIASPYAMIDRLVLYTDNYVPFSSLQRLLLIPTQELVQRFLYVDVTNADMMKRFSQDGFDVFGLRYRAPHDRDRQVARVKQLLRIGSHPDPSLFAYFDEEFYQLLNSRRALSVEGYLAYLDRYGVRYVIYPIQEKNNPFYRSVVGEVVFSNAMYEIKLRSSPAESHSP